MDEIPVRTVLVGDRVKAGLWRGSAMRVMGLLEHLMSYQDLQQCTLRRDLAPGVFVVADKRFDMRTVTIYAEPGGGEEPRWLVECFANRTCALAYIVSAMPIMPYNSQGNVVQIEDLDKPAPCAEPKLYVEEVYLTRDIRYSVAVCDGDGEYVLYRNIRATDFTPRCPGEMVLVMQNRTVDLPEGVLESAKNNPMAKDPFTYKLKAIESSISILPYVPMMEKRHEYQI